MSDIKAYTCPSCGGPLDFDDTAHNTIRCSYCGSSLSLPKEMHSSKVEHNTEHLLLSQVDILQQIGRDVRDGRKIEAIKLYRETFDVDLKEAKEVIDKIAAGEPFTIFNTDVETSRLWEQQAEIRKQTYSTPKPKVSLGKKLFNIIALLSVLGPVLYLAGKTVLDQVNPKGLAAVIGEVESIVDEANPLTQSGPTLTFGGEGIGAGLFSDARNIGMDADGNYYVSDYETGLIQVFNSFGVYQRQWAIPEDQYILSLDVDRDGNVFVVTPATIYKYEGATGTLLSEYQYPDVYSFNDIATTVTGDAIVSYHQGPEDFVLRIDPTGAISQVSETPIINGLTDDAELNPLVTVDGLGNIYILGSFNETVVKISPEGQLITRFGGAGDEAGQFTSPGSIAVDQVGNIYIGDFFGVMVFDGTGRYLETIKTDSFARDLLITPQNELVVLGIDQFVKVYSLQD